MHLPKIWLVRIGANAGEVLNGLAGMGVAFHAQSFDNYDPIGGLFGKPVLCALADRLNNAIQAYAQSMQRVAIGRASSLARLMSLPHLAQVP